MDEKVRKILKYSLSLLVAAVLLWYSFRGVAWNDFLLGLKSCRWAFVGMSMGAGALAFLFRAFRWRRIMLPIDPSIDRLTVFNAVNIGNISNFIFQYLGEFVRTGIIIQHDRKRQARYDRILGTVVLERGWDIISLIILFVILLSFKWSDFGAFFQEEIWSRLASRFSTEAYWMLGAGTGLLLLLGVSVILFRREVALFGKICGVFKGLLQGVGSCLKMERKWLFFIYTAAIWGMYWLMMVFMIQAFPGTSEAGMTIIDALFLMLVGSIASFIPVPGGFGAYHFLVSAALAALYGFSKSDGMVFATLAHESQAVNMAIWGLICYTIELVRKDRRSKD